MIDCNEMINKQFFAFDQSYISEQKKYAARLSPLEKKLSDLQERGNSMAASDQRMIECKWLLQYTANWKALQEAIDGLSESLKNKDQAWAEGQSSVDGSWGPCYTQWFLKVDAMIDAVNEMADEGIAPQYPFDFMAPIATAEKMQSWLNDQRTSKIYADGLDRRDALGAVTAALSEMCFKSEIRDYFRQHVKGFDLSDAYIAAYKAWLDDWQDTETGYWGAWFEQADGPLVKSTDLSLTFHNISYQHGKVACWPQIFATTLALRDGTYPYGWKHNGDFNNHNNYDVAKIFAQGWSSVDDAAHQQASTDIGDLLDWCLNVSMTADGGFIDDTSFYNSVGAAYYYGVSFLDEIGYFEPAKCFWTDETFPEGPSLCRKIQKNMKMQHLDDDEADAAMEKLVAACGDCNSGKNRRHTLH